MYLHTCINSSFGHCIFAAKTYCNPIMERLDEILEIVREIREDIAYMKRHRNMLCGTPILEVSEVCDLLKISDRQLRRYCVSGQLTGWLQQQTTVEVPAGQHIRLTLGDGSIVELNAQSRIVYPAIFPKGERRVQLSGEAIFNVAHNSECPFIVETFACDVEVLGTHFDVIANQAENRFSTALFSGRVAVTNKKNGESVILQPNDIVNLRDGGFQIQELEDKDDYLWMDGIISVYGMPFEQLMSKLERSYNVKIEIRRETMPVVKYKSLKIRVSDGIDHALHMLQLASDFTFEHDAVTDVIIIK